MGNGRDREAPLPPSRPPASPRAWWIAILLFLSMTVNFLDRLVLSSVAPVLRSELRFTNAQYSYIVFAFMLGMTLGQIPAGALTDRIGVRRTLPAIFAGWSLANLLQSFASRVSSFAGLRLAMGVFECGNYPAGLKAVGELFPADQAAFALGIFNSGSILGSVVAPPIVVTTIHHLGWRAAFFVPSAAGLIWIIPWLQATRAKPQSTSQRPAREDLIPLGALFRPRQAWGVILMRGFTGPLGQFYWYWLPLYLVRARGLTLSAMAGMASLAFLLGGCGQVGGGYFSGWLIRRGVSVTRSRKVTFTAGGILAIFSTLLVPLVPSVRAANLLAGMSIFGINVMSNMVIAVITDVFPQATLARVTGMTGVGEGMMNMVMTLGTGNLVDRFSFLPVFIGGAFLPAAALAGLFFLVRDCRLMTAGELAHQDSAR